MKYIANILTDKKFDDCKFYNVVNKKEDIIVGLPTLVIGWELTKTLYPETNITSWEIDKDTYWTFGNRERRQRYEETLIKFRTLAISRIVKSVKYKYISAIEGNGLEALLDNFSDFNLYIYNNMVYITGKDTIKHGSYVYGFSLKEYEYMGIDVKQIYKKIYNSNINIIKSTDEIPWEIKDALKSKNYIIPCLY